MKNIGMVMVFALSLAGCATYVPIKSVRPPTINTSGIQRLAVKDFENKSGVGGSLGAQLTQYLTDQAKQIIPATGYFTIVGANDPNAEGVFTGEVKSIVVKNSSEPRQTKDKDGKVINYTLYMRDVSVEFSYSVISSRNDMPVGSVNKSGSQNTSAEQSSALTDPLALAKKIVDSQLRTLERDVVPTIVSTNRALMKETSKDKAVKQLMKMARTLVRNGNYEEAIRQYDQIDREFGSVAARVNADTVRQAVASDSSARAQLAQLYSDKDGLAERAAKSAVDALNAKLPSGANIMIAIANSRSPAERNMLDYTVEQITKNIVQGGKLRVVDRSNLDLINAELQYQASGNVSDDSFVSIGKQLGAQYIVLCGISGQASLRRLTLRVLNVETAQIVDQNDFEI